MLLSRVTQLHNSNFTTYAYNNKYYPQLLFEENPHTAARNSLTIVTYHLHAFGILE